MIISLDVKSQLRNPIPITDKKNSQQIRIRKKYFQPISERVTSNMIVNGKRLTLVPYDQEKGKNIHSHHLYLTLY